MFKHQVILCCFFGLGVAKSVYFTTCGSNGFSCSSTRSFESQTITYQCPNEEKDILLKINDFESPPNAISLIIENCPEITISFQCSSQVRYIQSMFIRNLGILKIQQDPLYQTHLPHQVVMENVSYIENIPSFAFSQIDKASHNIKCAKPHFDLKLLQFKNVVINNIQTNGIYMPNDAGNLIFKNVNIGKIRRNAILVNMSDPFILQIDNSTIGIVGNDAIQVYGRGMILCKSTFDEISPSGIKALVDHMYFYENSINILQSQAISVTAQKVFIWKNFFEDIKIGALEKISPRTLPVGLGADFTYKFLGNKINRMEKLSLHPDFQGHKKRVTMKFLVKKNEISCSCENSGWLFYQSGQTTPLQKFYATFTDKKYGNTCSGSCKLSIAATKTMFRDEKCQNNITVEDLCLDQKRE